MKFSVTSREETAPCSFSMLSRFFFLMRLPQPSSRNISVEYRDLCKTFFNSWWKYFNRFLLFLFLLQQWRFLEVLFLFHSCLLKLVHLSLANRILKWSLTDVGSYYYCSMEEQSQRWIHFCRSITLFFFPCTILGKTESTEWQTMHGRDIWTFSSPNLCLKEVWLEQVARSPVLLSSEFLQGWRVHSVCGQPVPIPGQNFHYSSFCPMYLVVIPLQLWEQPGSVF